MTRARLSIDKTTYGRGHGASSFDDATMEVEKQMPEEMEQQFDDDLDDHRPEERTDSQLQA